VTARLFISLAVFISIFAVGPGICADAVAQESGQAKALAKIGDSVITEKDLNDIAAAVPERFRHLYLTPEGRKKTIEYIVNVYVLAEQARKEGLDEKPRVKRLQRFTNNDLLARLYLEEKSKGIPEPTEADAKKYYDERQSDYTTPESVHLRHILVKTEKEADRVVKRLKKGEKFSDLASELSQCPTKYKGGDLGWLPKGTLVKPIEEVAFNMSPNDMKGPVQSTYGWHILLLEDKRPATRREFEDVKAYIIEQIKFQRQQENYQKLAEDLKKKMDVKIMEDQAAKQEGAKQ
jgi:peptidyl-prolyl cis-trans isomerase C